MTQKTQNKRRLSQETEKPIEQQHKPSTIQHERKKKTHAKMKPTVFQVYYPVIGNKAHNHNKGYYFCIFYIEVVSYFICSRGIARRCCCGRSAAVVRIRHSEHRVQSSALPPLATSSQHTGGKNSLQIEYISKQLIML